MLLDNKNDRENITAIINSESLIQEETVDQINDIVFVEFTECRYGWIYFNVKAGGYEVNIRASGVFDPFPDLIAWLDRKSVV